MNGQFRIVAYRNATNQPRPLFFPYQTLISGVIHRYIEGDLTDGEAQAPESPSGAWLSTVTARRCIDRLRSHAHSRRDYPGPWLPEPILATHEDLADLTGGDVDIVAGGTTRIPAPAGSLFSGTLSR